MEGPATQGVLSGQGCAVWAVALEKGDLLLLVRGLGGLVAGCGLAGCCGLGAPPAGAQDEVGDEAQRLACMRVFCAQVCNCAHACATCFRLCFVDEAQHLTCACMCACNHACVICMRLCFVDEAQRVACMSALCMRVHASVCLQTGQARVCTEVVKV